MRRNLAFHGARRVAGGSATRPLACLAFVLVMAIAFWAGVLWLGDNILTLLFAS